MQSQETTTRTTTHSATKEGQGSDVPVVVDEKAQTEEKIASPTEAITWQHVVTVDGLAHRLGSHVEHGLDSTTARLRLEKHGPNVITPTAQKPLWLQILYHFTDFFSLMLLFAAVLCLIAFALDPEEDMHLYLAVFLFIVVVATSFFSFAQQYKSDKTLREFRNMLPPKATVRRGNHVQVIPASDLVVGDVVLIKLGDKIPADVRIIRNQRLAVDNSALTGESEPCERSVDKTSDAPLETNNLAFFGTLAVDGTATGIVIATGDSTVFGHIAHLTSDVASDAGATTLHQDIHYFVVVITIFAVAVGIFFFIVGMLKGTKLIRNIVYSIGIIVSNVPEGLLATVTVSLTASARRMARRNVLVKRLEAIETLGSTTVICSDKTGTLTQNRMTVAHVAHGGKVEVIHPKWAPPVLAEEVTCIEDRLSHQCLQALIFGATNCASAVFDHADMVANPDKTIDEREVSGDASEAGVLRFVERIHPVEEMRTRTPQVACIPFNSSNKYMVTVHRVQQGADALRALMKGAPERVLDKCDRIGVGDSERAITSQDRTLIDNQISYLAGRGERVLAFAQMDLSPQEATRILPAQGAEVSLTDIPAIGYTFVGLIALVDPPRASVPNAVQLCKTAGIRVVMVTGDHPATARSIASQVGIITGPVAGDEDAPVDSRENALVIHGSELEMYTEADWNRVLSHEQIVFARTSPHQKLQIVREFQRLNHIVSVTGDGVNDAPALKKANTGVAMGISGSEVSKEAADIVLLDDNFSSIVSGIEEGRLIFDNLKKSISYTLTSNVPQLIPFIVFVTTQLPLPLTTVLILCIDLGTDIFPAISMAYEKPEWDLMKRPPRDVKKDRLLNVKLLSYSMLQLGIIQSFGGFYAYFFVMNEYGLPPSVLPRLDRDGRFGTERIGDQRWLYTEQNRPDGFAFNAQWFSSKSQAFHPYFAAGRPGFDKQSSEVFNTLVVVAGNMTTTSGSVVVGPTVPGSAQFNNMVKIVSQVTNRPPCLSFACIRDDTGEVARNQRACWDVAFNSKQLYLTGMLDGVVNDKVRAGRGIGQGCFGLWTPRQERAVLEIAQTSFFAAVVVAQMFTLVVTKTRMLSVFQQGLSNAAVLVSLAAELVIAVGLVYIPVFHRGLNVRPLSLIEWILALPFAVFILVYDEMRKSLIRRHLYREMALREGTAGPIHVMDRFASFVHESLW
jgi:sodium/potassium-transporting ATPase subunit alpha